MILKKYIKISYVNFLQYRLTKLYNKKYPLGLVYIAQSADIEINNII